jgi:hypothetical protein
MIEIDIGTLWFLCSCAPGIQRKRGLGGYQCTKQHTFNSTQLSRHRRVLILDWFETIVPSTSLLVAYVLIHSLFHYATGLEDLTAKFVEEDVTPETLLACSDNDYKDLGVNLGKKKKIITGDGVDYFDVNPIDSVTCSSYPIPGQARRALYR